MLEKTFGRRVQRLWLVRHGMTPWNSEQRLCGHYDIALSTAGYTQARWVARRLQSQNIVAIYTSDLLRAQQTAQVIARKCAQPVQIEPSSAWRELAFGDWEGLTYAQIAEQAPVDFFTDPVHSTPPNGERFMALVERVQAAFTDLALGANNMTGTVGDIVLVSHGGTLRVLLCLLLSMPFERQWQLRIDPGSLSAIDFVTGTDDVMTTASLVALNIQAVPRAKNATAQARSAAHQHPEKIEARPVDG